MRETVSLLRVHCIHIWKCQNSQGNPFVQLIYASKNGKKKGDLVLNPLEMK
jgi:hypothetical protein